MTAEKIAKPVVKNKFWVVEDQGTKIATIQAKDDGGFVYVHDNQREYFPSVQILKKKYNIKFGTANKVTKLKAIVYMDFPYPESRLIRFMMLNENYQYTQKHPKAEVYFVQDTISLTWLTPGLKHFVQRISH
jgi:hypothetical protein